MVISRILEIAERSAKKTARVKVAYWTFLAVLAIGGIFLLLTILLLFLAPMAAFVLIAVGAVAAFYFIKKVMDGGSLI